MEKFEIKERWKLLKSDVLFGVSLFDFYEIEDVKYRLGNCGKFERITLGFVKISKWNKGFIWFSDF